eukprot:1057103-Prymnesium_polylepis.2
MRVHQRVVAVDGRILLNLGVVAVRWQRVDARRPDGLRRVVAAAQQPQHALQRGLHRLGGPQEGLERLEQQRRAHVEEGHFRLDEARRRKLEEDDLRAPVGLRAQVAARDAERVERVDMHLAKAVDVRHQVGMPRLHDGHRAARPLLRPQREAQLLDGKDERARLRRLARLVERRRELQVLVQPLAQRALVRRPARREVDKLQRLRVVSRGSGREARELPVRRARERASVHAEPPHHVRPLPPNLEPRAIPRAAAEPVRQRPQRPHVPEAERDQLHQHLRAQVAPVVVADHVHEQVCDRRVGDADQCVEQGRSPRLGRRRRKLRQLQHGRVEAKRRARIPLLRRLAQLPHPLVRDER